MLVSVILPPKTTVGDTLVVNSVEYPVTQEMVDVGIIVEVPAPKEGVLTAVKAHVEYQDGTKSIVGSDIARGGDLSAPDAPIASIDEATGATITGKTEPNATVEVKDSEGTVIASGKADENGDFTLELKPPLNDSEEVVVTATDSKGNGPSEPTKVVAPDNTLPSAPTNAPDIYDNVDADGYEIVEEADFELIGDGESTNDNTPTIKIPANSMEDDETPQLVVDGVVVEAIVEGSIEQGFTLTPKEPLTEGSHEITYNVIDGKDRVSDNAPVTSITVSTIVASDDVAYIDMGALQGEEFLDIFATDEGRQKFNVIDLTEGNEGDVTTFTDADPSFVVRESYEGDITITVEQNGLASVAEAYNIAVFKEGSNEPVYVGATKDGQPLIGDVAHLEILGLTDNNGIKATIKGLEAGKYYVKVINESSELTKLLAGEDSDSGVILQNLGSGGAVLGDENQEIILEAVRNALNDGGGDLNLGNHIVGLLEPVLSAANGTNLGGLLQILTTTLKPVSNLIGGIDGIVDGVAQALLSNTLTLLQNIEIDADLTEYKYAETEATGELINPTGDDVSGKDTVDATTKVTKLTALTGSSEDAKGVLSEDSTTLTVKGEYGVLVVDVVTGSYTYTANGAVDSFAKADVFEYQITGGNGVSDTAKLTINLSGDIMQPKIDTVTNTLVDGVDSTVIEGYAQPNSTVVVDIDGDGVLDTDYQAVADANGKFTLTVPEIANGSTVDVQATDGAKYSEKTSVVGDTEAPAVTVDSVVNSGNLVEGTETPVSTTIKGTSEPNSIVSTEINGEVFEAVTKADGTYTLVVSEGLANGQTIEVVSKDAYGNTSEPIEVIGTNIYADDDSGVLSRNDLILESSTESLPAETEFKTIDVADGNAEQPLPNESGYNVTVDEGRSGDVTVKVSQKALLSVADAFNIELYDADNNLVAVATSGTKPLVGSLAGLEILGVTDDGELSATFSGLESGDYYAVVSTDSSALGDLLSSLSLSQLGQDGATLSPEAQQVVLDTLKDTLNGGLDIGLGTLIVPVVEAVLSTTDAIGVGVLLNAINKTPLVGLTSALDKVLGVVSEQVLKETLVALEQTTVSADVTQYSYVMNPNASPVTGNIIDPNPLEDKELGEDRVSDKTELSGVSFKGTQAIEVKENGVTFFIVDGEYGQLKVVKADGTGTDGTEYKMGDFEYVLKEGGDYYAIGETDSFEYTLTEDLSDSTAKILIGIATDVQALDVEVVVDNIENTVAITGSTVAIAPNSSILVTVTDEAGNSVEATATVDYDGNYSVELDANSLSGTLTTTAKLVDGEGNPVIVDTVDDAGNPVTKEVGTTETGFKVPPKLGITVDTTSYEGNPADGIKHKLEVLDETSDRPLVEVPAVLEDNDADREDKSYLEYTVAMDRAIGVETVIEIQLSGQARIVTTQEAYDAIKAQGSSLTPDLAVIQSETEGVEVAYDNDTQTVTLTVAPNVMGDLKFSINPSAEENVEAFLVEGNESIVATIKDSETNRYSIDKTATSSQAVILDGNPISTKFLDNDLTLYYGVTVKSNFKKVSDGSDGEQPLTTTDYADTLYVGYYANDTPTGSQSNIANNPPVLDKSGEIADGFGYVATIDMGGGDDIVKVRGSQGGAAINDQTRVYLGEGNDQYYISGNMGNGTQAHRHYAFGESGDDYIEVGGNVEGYIYAGSGSDEVLIKGNMKNLIDLGSGTDENNTNLPSENIYQRYYQNGYAAGKSLGNDDNIDLETDTNKLTIEGTLSGTVKGGNGVDNVHIAKMSGGEVELGANTDTITIGEFSGGTVYTGHKNNNEDGAVDTIDIRLMNGGTLNVGEGDKVVSLADSNPDKQFLDLKGGTINLSASDDDFTLLAMTGGTINLGGGDDVLTLKDGKGGGTINGGSGFDTLVIEGSGHNVHIADLVEMEVIDLGKGGADDANTFHFGNRNSSGDKSLYIIGDESDSLTRAVGLAKLEATGNTETKEINGVYYDFAEYTRVGGATFMIDTDMNMDIKTVL